MDTVWAFNVRGNGDFLDEYGGMKFRNERVYSGVEQRKKFDAADRIFKGGDELQHSPIAAAAACLQI